MIVSVRARPDYDAQALEADVRAHFEAVGAGERIRPGMTVVIKPNLVAARRPELAATTHPLVVRAVAAWCRDVGAKPVVAESPSGPYTAQTLRAVYAACGMKELGDLAALNYDTSFRPVRVGARMVNVISPILDADAVIDVAKLKTHAMTVFSGGVKNLFGCVPGLQKPEAHYAVPDPDAFGAYLASLARFVAPAVTVLDAITCMEGNGPTAGRARSLGLTMASADPFALDWYAARLVGLDPEGVPMLRCAEREGWLAPHEIEPVGDAPGKVEPFLLPDTHRIDFMSALPYPLRAPARRVCQALLTPKPVIDTRACVGCGKCAESCPAHRISVENGKARIDYGGCIRCFCCQEMCPARAVRVRRRIAMLK